MPESKDFLKAGLSQARFSFSECTLCVCTHMHTPHAFGVCQWLSAFFEAGGSLSVKPGALIQLVSLGSFLWESCLCFLGLELQMNCHACLAFVWVTEILRLSSRKVLEPQSPLPCLGQFSFPTSFLQIEPGSAWRASLKCIRAAPRGLAVSCSTLAAEAVPAAAALPPIKF